MRIKYLLIAALSLLAVALIGFFIVYRSARTTEGERALGQPPRLPSPEPREPVPVFSAPLAGSAGAGQFSGLAPSAPPGQEPGPLEALVLPEFVPKLKKAVEQFLVSVAEPLPLPQPSPPKPQSSSSITANSSEGILLAFPPPGIPQPLTEREIFDLLYPAFYLDSLRSAQEFLAGEGVIKPGGKLEFKTEREVRDFTELLMRDLLSRGFIDQAGFDTARTGGEQVFNTSYQFKLGEAVVLKAIREGETPPAGSFVSREEALREFKDLLLQQGYDFDALRLQSPGSSAALVAPRMVSGESQVLSRHLVPLAKFLTEFFSIPEARAACFFTCVVAPECYMGGAPTPGGVNIPAIPCCLVITNCKGLDKLGCFNLASNGSKPFIWDPTTSICGIG